MSRRSRLRVAALLLVVLAAAAVNVNAEGPSKKKFGEARIKGMRAAVADIEKGVLKQKEYPPIPAPVWHLTYTKLLKSEYGIDWEVIRGPSDTMLDTVFGAEVEGYNDVMRAEAEHRHGRGIFEKQMERAKKE